MLLREFTIENHIISLVQDGKLYIAKITDKNGDRLLYHEYEDYERIKGSFDEIVQAYQRDKIGIEEVIRILERNRA